MTDAQLAETLRTYITTPVFQNYVMLAYQAIRHGTSVAQLLGPSSERLLLRQFPDILNDYSYVPLQGFNYSLEPVSEDAGWSSSGPDNFGIQAVFTEISPIPRVYNDFVITITAKYPYSPFLESDWDVQQNLKQLDLLADKDNWDRCRSCLAKRSHTSPNCGGYNSMHVIITKTKMLAQEPYLQVRCSRIIPEDMQEYLMDDPYARVDFRNGHQQEVQDLVQHICKNLKELYSDVRCPGSHDFCFIHRSRPSASYEY
jgi:hypothetical protein